MRIFPPAYAFPVENALLWGLLRGLGIRSRETLLLFHLSLVLLFVGLTLWILRRRLPPERFPTAALLFFLSPFPFTAAVLHLPNNDGLTLLLMTLAWALPSSPGRLILGVLLGWSHYPTAFLGWIAWVIARGTRPSRSQILLLGGILLGWGSLRIVLTHLGVPPDTRLQFLAIWIDKILIWGLATLPLWVWSTLGMLWALVPHLPREHRSRLLRALAVALLAGMVVMDRTRVTTLVIWWSVLENLLLRPEGWALVENRRLLKLTAIWFLWPFTYVWENHLLLPFWGFRTLPF